MFLHEFISNKSCFTSDRKTQVQLITIMVASPFGVQVSEPCYCVCWLIKMITGHLIRMEPSWVLLAPLVLFLLVKISAGEKGLLLSIIGNNNAAKEAHFLHAATCWYRFSHSCPLYQKTLSESAILVFAHYMKEKESITNKKRKWGCWRTFFPKLCIQGNSNQTGAGLFILRTTIFSSLFK